MAQLVSCAMGLPCFRASGSIELEPEWQTAELVLPILETAAPKDGRSAKGDFVPACVTAITNSLDADLRQNYGCSKFAIVGDNAHRTQYFALAFEPAPGSQVREMMDLEDLARSFRKDVPLWQFLGGRFVLVAVRDACTTSRCEEPRTMKSEADRLKCITKCKWCLQRSKQKKTLAPEQYIAKQKEELDSIIRSLEYPLEYEKHYNQYSRLIREELEAFDTVHGRSLTVHTGEDCDADDYAHIVDEADKDLSEHEMVAFVDVDPQTITAMMTCNNRL
eukprot:CAMPEP_0206149168 /NCGR_PEP_ID=MMETSP1473-20131121/37636_1 /ASSEMBLY_ACC=CAM_ASM_001109 /TAXON_ID=1461547 /ORGANISM="Stichococcus sp, Strain RCC1054" /LENGTH=276 /DNA_ID=CAMNT_0053546617 /DNA_START=572 /DNA_END=1402 /DNA_ORIENTATION=-